MAKRPGKFWKCKRKIVASLNAPMHISIVETCWDHHFTPECMIIQYDNTYLYFRQFPPAREMPPSLLPPASPMSLAQCAFSLSFMMCSCTRWAQNQIHSVDSTHSCCAWFRHFPLLKHFSIRPKSVKWKTSSPEIRCLQWKLCNIQHESTWGWPKCTGHTCRLSTTSFMISFSEHHSPCYHRPVLCSMSALSCSSACACIFWSKVSGSCTLVSTGKRKDSRKASTWH